MLISIFLYICYNTSKDVRALAYIIIAIMFVVTLGVIVITSNGNKVNQTGPRHTRLIAVFRNGCYYDLTTDERFLKIGRFKKYGKTSFICSTTKDEYELRDFIINTLDIDRANINIQAKRW